MRCTFTPKAEDDLAAIADWIAEDNPSRAVSFIREIRKRCDQVAEFPKASPERAELGPGIRMTVHRDYLIFYREAAIGMIVLRVLHGARDYRFLFE
jgi:toxin ParE1/3/4